MSNTNNVMNEGLPSNVICSDPYGCTFEEIVELLGEKSGRAFFRTLYKEKPKIQNQTIKVNSIENGGDTKKYAFELNDGYCIETVSITRKTGTTVCFADLSAITKQTVVPVVFLFSCRFTRCEHACS